MFLIKKSSPAVVEKETPQNISKRKEKEKKSSTKTYIYKTGKTQFCRTPHCRRHLLNTPFLPTNSFQERREPAAVLSARQTANPPSTATAQDQTSTAVRLHRPCKGAGAWVLRTSIWDVLNKSHREPERIEKLPFISLNTHKTGKAAMCHFQGGKPPFHLFSHKIYPQRCSRLGSGSVLFRYVSSVIDPFASSKPASGEIFFSPALYVLKIAVFPLWVRG